MRGHSRAHPRRVVSSGPAPAHGPTPAQEPTQGHTGGVVIEPDVHETVECAVLDVGGVGRILGIARATVYALDAREELPGPVLLGRRRRWGKAELEAWVLHGAPKRAAWERIWPRVRKEVLRR